jgi:hypothetical protein
MEERTAWRQGSQVLSASTGAAVSVVSSGNVFDAGTTSVLLQAASAAVISTSSIFFDLFILRWGYNNTRHGLMAAIHKVNRISIAA